jgi:hypothetical protein
MMILAPLFAAISAEYENYHKFFYLKQTQIYSFTSIIFTLSQCVQLHLQTKFCPFSDPKLNYDQNDEEHHKIKGIKHPLNKNCLKFWFKFL